LVCAGVVSGLVGITPAAGTVTPMWSLFIGGFTSLVVYFQPKFVKLLKIDDRLDCYAFHGAGGIVGSLLTGLFTTTQTGMTVNGGFYGDGMLYARQIAAILVTVLFSVIGTSIIFGVLYGLSVVFKNDMHFGAGVEPDLAAHGENAYNSRLSTENSASLTDIAAKGIELRSVAAASAESNITSKSIAVTVAVDIPVSDIVPTNPTTTTPAQDNPIAAPSF
jgi:hypothetical protein